MTKSQKHCVKRRNCTFCAISPFVTMFSNSRLKASIWGKGLMERYFGAKTICLMFMSSFNYALTAMAGLAYNTFNITLFRCIKMHLQQMTFLKQWQKGKLLIMIKFSLCHNVFIFIQDQFFPIKRISLHLTKLCQSRLLQNCFI